MSDKSNKYGYVGVDIPEQSFGNNKGIFNPAEINELVADNKWTQYGQLELIETQTISSSVAQVDFTSIKESTYNVHFLTVNNVENANGNNEIELTFLQSGSQVDVNQRAHQRMRASGLFDEMKSTSTTHTLINSNSDNTGGYVYIYNAGDSSKYTFTTSHSAGLTGAPSGSTFQSLFGSGVRTTADTVDGFRVYADSSNLTQGTISLYGIKEYS